MARYCKFDALCNVLFVAFTAVWFVTRVGIYPFRIIYSTLIEAPALITFYAAYYTFNFLLLLLLVLHVFWSIMILKIAINAVKSGQTDDVRSDDEDSDEDNEVGCDDDDKESTKGATCRATRKANGRTPSTKSGGKAKAL